MHLLVAITPHGFGHAAQVAPVLNALARRQSDLRVSIQTTLPADMLRARIDVPFTLIDEAPDFGLCMHSALEINLQASALRYEQMHSQWQTNVAAQADLQRKIAPDLLLADVPYLSLAAAHAAGIPSVALCSLNWADIYRHYFSDRPEAPKVLAQMQEAYRRARAFLRPEPSMPMPFLDNGVTLAPIAAQVQERRARLNQVLDIDARKNLVVVATGGVDTRLPVENWPRHPDMHWLVNASWQVRRDDFSTLEETGMQFTELLASCDAVLGKCGYGTVTECVANRTPLLYFSRPHWPEEETLERWLGQHRAGVRVPQSAALDGDLAGYVLKARKLDIAGCSTGGAEQAADYLASQTGQGD